MRTTLLLAVLLSLAPATVRGTVGGPTVVEVIGYASIDRKIYWLERHEGEGDAPPQLWYVRVDGPRAGKAIAVKSWYDDAAGFETRLARLRTHVRPLTETTSRWALDTEVVASGTWNGEALGFGDRPQHEVRCELRDADARTTARPVTVTVYETPRVVIAQAFAIRDGTAGLVVLRYLGDPFELGYQVDTAVPTRAR
jgi:hypothetical protein